MTSNPLLRLQEHDQAFWLDDLTRGMIRSGELARRVREEGLKGVTTNPAIVQKALAGDDGYGVQVAGLASEGRSVREIYDAIVVEDVRAACDVLRPVYEETDGRDGYVSLEVSPYLAYDPEGSLVEARRCVAAVERPNLMIKIPGTAAAVPAIEQALYEGINVNITLLFSVKRYGEVARAYVDALRRRLRERRPVSGLTSVASFFLSRIDVLADRMIAHRIRMTLSEERDPRPQDLLGKVAIENARHAYRVFERVFRGATWERLADAGARPQRLLWASTGNKNPLYDDLRYVEPLIGPQTVSTMPRGTAAEFRRRGRVACTLRADERPAREIADRLADVGLDLDDVTNRLEVEAVQKFLDPLDALFERIAAMRAGEPTDVAEAAAGVLDVDGLLARAQEQRLGMRLFAGDEALFAPPPEGRAPALLRAPELLLQRLAEMRDFADELRTDFQEVVIVASGECAALSRLALGLFPPGPDGPRVHVLDPTTADPDALLEPAWGPRAFLVIGPALDRSEALDRVLTLLEPRGVESPEFAVVAGEGSALARAVVERGFQRVLASPPELATGSGLSYEGMVPLALMGVDVEEVVRRAIEMRRSCGPEVPVRANPALRLGCVLGGLAARGRTILTLAADAGLEPLADWIRHLRPLGPGTDVETEVPGEPAALPNDRVLVRLARDADPPPEEDALLGPAMSAGHPVVRVRSRSGLDVGGELMRWEIASAAARALIRLARADRLAAAAPPPPEPPARERRRRWGRKASEEAPPEAPSRAGRGGRRGARRR